MVMSRAIGDICNVTVILTTRFDFFVLPGKYSVILVVLSEITHAYLANLKEV
jgi:hypothetical protein